jgi:2-polyprenyl-6-methoxyphenol hydroxylase-like FAD-dependent oxidoreductase
LVQGERGKPFSRKIDASKYDRRILQYDVTDTVNEIKNWEDMKLLTVRVDRLSQWFCPGLLCIGHAAHAMSPIGGVGINLAIQDAVAAANVLAGPLRERRLTIDELRRIQKRREFPTRVTQWAQVTIQRRVIARVLGGAAGVRPPLLLRLIAAIPYLRRIPARIIGIGHPTGTCKDTRDSAASPLSSSAK